MDGRGFTFDESTRVAVEERVTAELDHADVCFLDEVGRLELGNGGFAPLLASALASRCGAIILAVKKSTVHEVIDRFSLAPSLMVDLDSTTAAQALRQVLRRIASLDAERVGLFAGTTGLVEVGLGSTLHAFRVPFKGHFLAYLQCLLLVTFGKALHGRGLVRISLVGAMLKAFSPIGGAVRPMVYIFLQGCAFALPVRLLGWNVSAVITGSVLMSWLTLVISLGANYVTFGEALFEGLATLVREAGAAYGLSHLSLGQVFAGLFAAKAVLAVGVAVAAYYGDMQPLVRTLLRSQKVGSVADHAGRLERHPRTRLSAAAAALRDLARPRFLVFFAASTLLLLFFAKLSTSDWIGVVIRGLCISYLGFLVVRRMDFTTMADWLDRNLGLDIAQSLPSALNMLRASTTTTEPPKQ